MYNNATNKKKKKVTIRGVISTIVMIIGILIAYVGGVYLLDGYQNALTYDCKVKADLVGYETVEYNDSVSLIHGVYEYTVDGKTYTFTGLKGRFEESMVADTTIVAYYSDAPEMMTESKSLKVGFIFMAVGIIVIFLATRKPKVK